MIDRFVATAAIGLATVYSIMCDRKSEEVGLKRWDFVEEQCLVHLANRAMYVTSAQDQQRLGEF